MFIFISGLASGYQVEHLTRVFFPGAQLLNAPLRGHEDIVRAHCGRVHLWVALRQNGQVWYKRERREAAAETNPEKRLASMMYELLRRATGIRPPWGIMTGVRPVRIIHDARRAGKSEEEIADHFLRYFDCTPEKFDLALGIANLQRPIVRQDTERDYSIYIGIPFCPSRCSYCSFVSRTLERDRSFVQPYVDCLCREVEKIRDEAQKNKMHLKSIYIGGGTPTSLTAGQLRQLMGTVRGCFDLSKVEEYTVEAGRPDCTDREKLAVLKEYGANRISINPQTFSNQVLQNIGRRHTAQDIINCFRIAREVGHTNINMDLIAGLPGDTVAGFEASLRQAIALGPESITVHTLTLKRASNLVIEHRPDEYDDVEAMLEKGKLLTEAGYRPYYMYRQKNTLKNLENIGWSKPGHEGLYNIYIMEEIHSILAAGAGASTKLLRLDGSPIERIFNFKYPTEYVNGFDEVLKRKEAVSRYFGGE